MSYCVDDFWLVHKTIKSCIQYMIWTICNCFRILCITNTFYYWIEHLILKNCRPLLPIPKYAPTTDEATNIFIFKVCLNWYWQKATYIYFVDNIWGECSLSRCIVIVPTIWNTFLLSTISFVIVPIIWNRISFFPGLSVPCRRRNWIVLEQGRTIDFILFYFCILGFLVFN